MEAIEIKGRVNTAICYAKVVENEAIEQVRRMCDYVVTEGSKIRIMPDVHAGKGCTIGTTIRDFALKNKNPCSACEFQAKQGISIWGIKLLFFSV